MVSGTRLRILPLSEKIIKEGVIPANEEDTENMIHLIRGNRKPNVHPETSVRGKINACYNIH